MVTLLWYQWMALAALAICLTLLLAYLIRLIRLGRPVEYSRPAGDTGQAIRYSFTGAMSPVKKESAFLHLPTYTAGLFYHMGTFLSLFLFFFIISGLTPKGWLARAIIMFLLFSAGSGIAILVKRIIKKELRSLSNPDDFISNILVTLFQIITILIMLFPLYFPASYSPTLLPSYSPIVLPSYSPTVLPSYSPIVLPSYSPIVLPSYSPTVLPSYSPIVLQSYSPTVLQSYSPTVLISYYIIYSLLMLYIPVGKLRHTVYFFAARYHLGYFYGRRGVWPPEKLKSKQ